MKSVNAIILNKEKKFLVIKRKDGIHGGKWAFPGGIVEKNETNEQALKREVKEETGLEITKIIKKIAIYHYPRENKSDTQGTSYLVSVKSTRVNINDEVEEFRWVSIEELEELDHIRGLEDEALKVISLLHNTL